MKKEEQFLLWFEQLERKDVDIVGGKSSSLGEMTAKTNVHDPFLKVLLLRLTLIDNSLKKAVLKKRCDIFFLN